jgi:hypothetical protein
MAQRLVTREVLQKVNLGFAIWLWLALVHANRKIYLQEL